MIDWILDCRRERLARLKRERLAKAAARKLREAQEAAHRRLGARALIPPYGKSRFLYRP